MIKIKEITLLSAEEYEDYLNLITPSATWWWVKTPGTGLFTLERCSAFVGSKMVLSECGFIVRHNGGVRPALKLNMALDPFDYSVGDKLDLLGLGWTVLDINDNDLYVLCDDIVAERRFDPETNIWEVSELKDWLEEWLEYMVMGLDDVVYGEVPFDKKPGDICRVGKYDMIVLEERDGECLLLSKDLYRKNVAFGDTNYFGASNACKICSEFAVEIAEAVGFGNVVSHAVDLTSHSGDKKYRKVYSRASLLTEDMYKHYKDIVDTYGVDQIWWLATPKNSLDATSRAVSCVWPGGDTGYSYSLNSRFLALRPFCIIKTTALS